MSSAIATTSSGPSFEDRMMNKIKESIGDLVTDADLKRIVERGIERALFERRAKEVSTGWGGRDTQFEPCIVDTACRQYLEKQMQEAVNQWMKDNPDKIKEVMEKVIQNGVMGCVLTSLERHFQDVLPVMVNGPKSSGRWTD